MEGLQTTFCCGNQSILENSVVMTNDSAVLADLLHVKDGSGFYRDFQLSEFPCMLSSSTTPDPVRPPCSSSTLLSSSTTSWMALGHDGVTDMETSNCAAILKALFPTHPMEIILEKPSGQAIAEDATVSTSTAAAATFCGVYECMHKMENLGNPTLIFPSGNPFNEEVQDMGSFIPNCEDQKYQPELIRQHGENENNGAVDLERRCSEFGGLVFSDDIGAVFLEWLQANKGNISPDFLQKVKIKNSTVEMAVRRLGGGKEAMRQLLKLILQWVQNSRLNQKHTFEWSSDDLNHHLLLVLPNASPCPNPNCVPTQPVSTTSPEFPDAADFRFASRWPRPQSAFTHPNMNQNSAVIGTYLGNESLESHMLSSIPSWWQSIHWPLYESMENFHLTLGRFGGIGYGYPNQYPLQFFGNSGVSSCLKFEKLRSAATKEARRNRMARLSQSQPHRHHRITKSRQHIGSHHKVVGELGGGIIGSLGRKPTR